MSAVFIFLLFFFLIILLYFFNSVVKTYCKVWRSRKNSLKDKEKADRDKSVERRRIVKAGILKTSVCLEASRL